MKEERLQIPLADGPTITAIQTSPDKEESGEVFVYAPGAGSNLHDPFGVYLCRQLASDGFTAVRFQFPYMEAGLRRPDYPPVLEDAWRVVVERLRPDGGRLVIGGTSMGGRIASQVVAKGTIVDALALFAYPLRPPGRAQVRDGHLPQIGIPTLFCSGTRDSFGTAQIDSASVGRRRPRVRNAEIERQDQRGCVARGYFCPYRLAEVRGLNGTRQPPERTGLPSVSTHLSGRPPSASPPGRGAGSISPTPPGSASGRIP